MKKRYNQRQQGLYYTLSKSRGVQLHRIIDNIGDEVTKIVCDTCTRILNGDLPIKNTATIKLDRYKQTLRKLFDKSNTATIKLDRYKQTLRKLSDKSNSIHQRRNILNQKGSGILPILIPIITGLLFSILNK